VDAALYEKIIRLKTGVLFGAACQLGAVAAGMGSALQERWLSYGLRVGEAYQIADDLHEVEGHFSSRSIQASEIAALAPALLFFAEETRPALVEIARGASATLDGGLRVRFEAAAEAMKADIERRLRSAVSEIDGQLPDNGYGQLARAAPRALIEMFNQAGERASAR
jgi:geranylgeranyl pyrophosphate synthase